MKDNTTKKSNKSKTKKKIKKCIDCYEQPIYVPAKLYVIKGCTKKDIDKVFGWNDDGTSIVPDKDFYDALVCFPVRRKGDDGYSVAIILVDEFFEDPIDQQIGTAAHEALHAAQDILENCDIKLNRDTTEAYAFMVGWITKCIYTTIMKK